MILSQHKDQVDVVRMLLRRDKAPIDQKKADEAAFPHLRNKVGKPIKHSAADIRSLKATKSLLQLIERTLMNSDG